MVERRVHVCACPECQRGADAAITWQHQQMNLLMSTLSHQQRRWYAAFEANRRGSGGVSAVSRITGLSGKAISRGRRELADAGEGRWFDDRPRVYRGAQPAEEKYPDIEQVIEAMLAHEVAGDPMGEQMWVRTSLRNLSRQLRERGYDVSYYVVRRLLKKLGYTLRLNVKTRQGVQSPQRDEQFRYIATRRKAFAAAGQPIISVDAKKKEPIGYFRQAGRSWSKHTERVNQYDFTSQADYRAVPYGIYDVTKNAGYVYVGTSGNTPEFAVDAIVAWWRDEGQGAYPSARELLLLADGGGSNGWRARGWKCNLQKKLVDPFELRVTVCHYPTRCSKWNPVEYRLFSHISMNWAGKPLRTLDVMLAYIRGTKTSAGLSVKARRLEAEYLTARKVSAQELAELSLHPHSVCPNWNYTLDPPPREAP
jgi:hypothetical protein